MEDDILRLEDEMVRLEDSVVMIYNAGAIIEDAIFRIEGGGLVEDMVRLEDGWS